MAQSNRLRKPYPSVASILNDIDPSHGSKSFGTTKIVWKNGVGGTSIVLQIDAPPPVSIRFDPAMSHSKRLNELDRRTVSVWNGIDACHGSKSFGRMKTVWRNDVDRSAKRATTSNFGPIRVNNGSVEAPQRASSNDSLCLEWY